MPLFIPEDYTAKLAPETMEQAITYLKEIFPDMLARRLRLRRVTAPLFVLSGTGINDDLNGVERAVSFPIRDLGDRRAEVVHSLAKWKRMKLGTYKIAPGYGLYTDMNAIRADEELDNIHSLYVDQWDWERTMRPEERNLNFLKATVETIYEAMKAVEEEVYELYPHITPILPERITFLQAEELLQEFPALTPKEREQAAARKYGALFLIGIFPLLFVPAAAGVMDLWAELHAMLLPVLIALVPVTFLVMATAGRVTQRFAKAEPELEEELANDDAQ